MSSASVRIQPGAVLPAPKQFAPSLPFLPSLSPPLLDLAIGILRAVGRWQMGRSYPRSNDPEVVEMPRYKQARALHNLQTLTYFRW